MTEPLKDDQDLSQHISAPKRVAARPRYGVSADQEPQIKNKELPLVLQSTVFVVLWLVWPATIAWVSWIASENARRGAHFAHESLINFLLLGCFPLILTIAGAIFHYRLRTMAKASTVFHVLYSLIIVLTILSAITSLFGFCTAGFPVVQNVRE